MYPDQADKYKALNDFAEYVEQQQNVRYPTARSTTSGPTKPTDSTDQHHVELDELFDNLDLVDAVPRVPLRELLLRSDDESLEKLKDLIAERIEEGFGEAVFEIGYEHNGDLMQLTREEWDRAYKTLTVAAKRVRADCNLLLTSNVGGDVEAASTADKTTKDKGDKSCTGKVLIRQNPASIEDVIETRIAVVGNGKNSWSIDFPEVNHW